MRFLRASNPILIKGPARVTGLFLLFSVAWIVVTDLLFGTYLNTTLAWHTAKGLLYVASSGMVLFWLCRVLVFEAQRWERTLLEIFRQTEIGVCFTEPDGRILDCNNAYARILGYSDSELVGRNFFEPVDPSHLEGAKANIQELFERRASGAYVRERKFVRRDGSPIWARVTGSRIDPGGRQKPFLVALLQDVTCEVNAYHALEKQDLEIRDVLAAVQESENRFRGLAECSTTGIAVACSDGRILDANGEFLRMLGYSHEELEAGMLNWLENTPSEYHSASLSAIADLKITHKFAPYENEYIAKSGTRIPILISGGWLSDDEQGNSMFVISVIDLRSARRAEAQLSRLVQAVESGHESIVITETDGSIVYVNPAFEALTGYARAEVLGKNPRILQSGRTTRGEYEDLWGTLREGRTWKGRFWNRRKDGTEYLEDATISPVRDNQGKIINYLAVKKDISREHSLENRVVQTQKLEAVGQLTGGVAHDLNNVLQVISCSVELALRRTHDAGYTHNKLLDILTATKRGAGIISQLLAFTRKRGLSPQMVDLNQVVGETGTMLRRLLPENVELVLDLGPDLFPIQADPVRLSQVLLNLAVNARDAMPNGGVLGIASTNVQDRQEGNASVRVIVQDTGCGMSAQTITRMFEPFFTTKEAGRGTGLGLATVKEIVDQAGATMTVESELGKGTRFQIDFPAKTNSDAGTSGPDKNKPAADDIALRGSILVCEDDLLVRTAICDYLSALGLEVISCGNAQEAIAKASEANPNILITDLIMPGTSGLQLAQELRSRNRDLKVLLMTGHTEHEVLTQVEAEKDISLLQKPFTGVSLMRHLRELNQS